MTKIYPIISLNSELYMIDKEAIIKKDDWYMDIDMNYSQCVDEDLNKIIASTDKTLGLPLLPSVEEEAKRIFEAGRSYGYTECAKGYGVDFPKGTPEDKKPQPFDIWIKSLNPIPTSIEVEMDIDNPCPKCGTENVHGNYDYSKKELPLIDNLCNECGEFFNSIPKVDENNFVKIIKWI